MTDAALTPRLAADAAGRLAGQVRRTPLLRSPLLDARLPFALGVKAESLQHTGSFKVRGALNALLARERLPSSVITASAGNHAHALAYACRRHGIQCIALMPEDAPHVKRRGVLLHGGVLVPYDRHVTDREALLRGEACEREATIVHAFDDPQVIAGQATATLELLDDWPQLDAILVPVSGGGLLAGAALALGHTGHRADLLGVEPAGADDWWRSVRAGDRRRVDAPVTIADGLRAPSPGALCLEVARPRLGAILRVSDDAIRSAMRVAAEVFGLLLEPSGACALAGALTLPADLAGQRHVAVVASGSNIDAPTWTALAGYAAPVTAIASTS